MKKTFKWLYANPFPFLCLVSLVICSIAWGECFAPWNVACFQNGGWGDHKFHYQGWISYLHSTDFIPPYLYSFTWPAKSSVMFTDSIPIAALVFKPITLMLRLGDWHYFSVLSVANSILIAWCTCKISKHLSWNATTSIALGIVLLTSNISWSRLYYSHEALQLHSLLVLALTWIIIDKKNIESWSLLTVVSIGVHSYYMPMIIACALSQLRIEFNMIFIRKLLTLFAAIALAMYLFGFLPSSFTIDSEVWGANMLTFLDPQQHSSIFAALQKREPFEVEGYSYLGLGLLLGIAASLISDQSDTNRQLPFTRRWWFIAIALFVFSLGHTWNIADTPITPHKAVYALPGFSNLYSIFRSSGRFTWPLYYSIVIWMFSRLDKHQSSRLLLPIVVILQLLDSNLRLIFRQGSSFSRRMESPNHVFVWAQDSQSLSKYIAGAKLFFVGRVNDRSILPPPYTPQYLNPKIYSNWGGEGITRLPSSHYSSSTIESFVSAFNLLNQVAHSDVPYLCSGYALYITDHPSEIENLHHHFGTKLEALTPHIFRIHGVCQ